MTEEDSFTAPRGRRAEPIECIRNDMLSLFILRCELISETCFASLVFFLININSSIAWAFDSCSGHPGLWASLLSPNTVGSVTTFFCSGSWISICLLPYLRWLLLLSILAFTALVYFTAAFSGLTISELNFTLLTYPLLIFLISYLITDRFLAPSWAWTR